MESIDNLKRRIQEHVVAKKVTTHVHEHETAYAFVAGVVVTGFTLFIMRSNAARGAASESRARGALTNTASFIFNSPQTVKVTTVLDRDGRGHPGWPVRNLETKRIFLSQKDAAKAFDIPQKLLSSHLKGKFPDVDGLHFERVNLLPQE